MFGVNSRVGLGSTTLPYEINHQLQTEGDIRAVCQGNSDTRESVQAVDNNVNDVSLTVDEATASDTT